MHCEGADRPLGGADPRAESGSGTAEMGLWPGGGKGKRRPGLDTSLETRSTGERFHMNDDSISL